MDKIDLGFTLYSSTLKAHIIIDPHKSQLAQPRFYLHMPTRISCRFRIHLSHSQLYITDSSKKKKLYITGRQGPCIKHTHGRYVSFNFLTQKKKGLFQTYQAPSFSFSFSVNSEVNKFPTLMIIGQRTNAQSFHICKSLGDNTDSFPNQVIHKHIQKKDRPSFLGMVAEMLCLQGH